MHEVFIEENIKKGNTLQTAAFQPHGGIALYRDILANVLDFTYKDSEKSVSVQENNEENVAMPMLEDGNPDFVGAGAQKSADFLERESGFSDEDIDGFVDANIAEAEKALADAEGKKPAMSTDFKKA